MTELNARYERNWYYCWLVERRDRAQPHWMCNDGTWTTDANKAQWFARRSDADEVAGEILSEAIVCEHGFMLDKSADAGDRGLVRVPRQLIERAMESCKVNNDGEAWRDLIACLDPAAFPDRAAAVFAAK